MGGVDLPSSMLLDLTRRYCEPHRRFHTIHHVADLLWRGRELELDDCQIMAIWFHDAVYDVPPKANEERSAVLAETMLEAAGWPRAMISTVATIVRDTEQHVPTIEPSKLVVDLDLASLASPKPEFEANTARLREEYSVFDDDEFREGQRVFFRRFLERDRIYHSPWGRQFEAPARANIERLIAG